MLIPRPLAKLLAKNKGLEAKVHASIEEISSWLEAGGKRPTFFPDYTDHSIAHIEEVLATATDLIRKEAARVLTPDDAAVLIIAALLHDSAMHLSKEGFESLVTPNSSWLPIHEFDKQPWSRLWADFCTEARRFDQRKMIDLFGNAEPVRIPEVGKLTLDEQARRLIGEFIRRHHPRLAHEIALYGVPGTDQPSLRLQVPQQHADLSGLVARSHGLPARACLTYLKRNYGNRVDPHGIHAVFLMALLRVSDYLQIQASRAPTRLHQVHKISSPYSKIEWQVHESVKDIRESEDDPEAVFVRAEPQNVETYLRLKKWLDGLQVEIDATWAVLGEIYGRQSRSMNKLGLKIRRILSSIDGTDFKAQLPYLADHVTFTTANAELLRLLIAPLYGYQPEVGIRELIQNAIDAVRERRDLEKRGLLLQVLDSEMQSTDVVVAVQQRSDQSWWLTVSDRGIGMSAEVICQYFLRAGASFRTSDTWIQHFTDSNAQAQVLRSGRFGIGALAAFLLGNEIHVETRHVEAPREEGLKFSACIDTDPIEIRRISRDIGTSISIRLHSQAEDVIAKRTIHAVIGSQPVEFSLRSRWDWYCLSEPEVVRIIDPPSIVVPQRYVVPQSLSDLPDGWRRLTISGYEDIHWTYKRIPALVCNGIKVQDASETAEFDENKVGIPLQIPSLSIFDPDGNLPLTIQRDSLTTSEYPFQAELLEDVLTDYIAAAVSSAPDRALLDDGDKNWYMGGKYSGAYRGSEQFSSMWGSTPEGVFPVQAHNLWDLNLTSIVLHPRVINPYSGAEYPIPSTLPKRFTPPTVLFSFSTRAILKPFPEIPEQSDNRKDIVDKAAEEFLRITCSVLGGESFDDDDDHPLDYLFQTLSSVYRITGVKAFVPAQLAGQLKPILEEISPSGVIATSHANNMVWLNAISPTSATTATWVDKLSKQKAVQSFPAVEWLLERQGQPLPPAKELERVWRSMLPVPYIPFDEKERAELIEASPPRLQTLIDEYRRLAAEKNRTK